MAIRLGDNVKGRHLGPEIGPGGYELDGPMTVVSIRQEASGETLVWVEYRLKGQADPGHTYRYWWDESEVEVVPEDDDRAECETIYREHHREQMADMELSEEEIRRWEEDMECPDEPDYIVI